METTDTPLKADVLLLLVTLLAAFGWIFSKEALFGLPPLMFIGSRFLLAGVVLTLTGWRAVRRLSGQQLLHSLGVGVVFAISMGFWILGLAHSTHVGVGAFIASLGVVLVPILARFMFGDHPPLITWIALPVAVAGFALLSLGEGVHIELGHFFFLAAAASFAMLFNLNSRIAGRISPIALTAVQLVVVGVVILPVSALTETWPAAIAPSILGWLLASAFIATTMRFFIQVYAQGLTTPSHAAVIMMLEPVWTALAAAIWFGETMSLPQFLGCTLIFTALVMNRWNWIRRLLKAALVHGAPRRSRR